MRFVPVFAGVGAAALLAGMSVVVADSHNGHGRAVSAVSTSRATEGEAHGDAVSAVAKAHEDSRPATVKLVVPTTEPRLVVSAACSTALGKLKAAVSADRTEDQSERKGLELAGAPEANEIAAVLANRSADQAEDASELTAVRNALTGARAVCVRPEVLEAESTACTAAENAFESARDRQVGDLRFRILAPALLTSLQRTAILVCGS
jgi:hypothetical protein